MESDASNDSDIAMEIDEEDDERSHLRISEEHEKRLTRNLYVLVQRVFHVDQIILHLKSVNVLSLDEWETIDATRTRSEKVRILFRYLCSSSEAAFYHFLEALAFTQSDNFIYNKLKDQTMPDPVPNIQIMYGLWAEYRNKLNSFHQNNLDKLLKAKPNSYDMSKYVTLRQHATKVKAIAQFNTRKITSLSRSKETIPLLLPELFDDIEHYSKDPRTVLLVGVPGIGKTMTALHVLQKFLQREWFQKRFKFTFIIKFRELNKVQESLNLQNRRITFKELLLKYCGPPLGNLNPDVIWNYLEENKRFILFILDGYDELFLGDHEGTLSIEFPHTTEPETALVLIHNLLLGNIMNESKVLVTSRPKAVITLDGIYHRLVELNGLTDEGLEEMARNELGHIPGLAEAFIQYLWNHPDMKGLCVVPAHCKDLLDHINYCSSSRSFTRNLHDTLPTTKASLLFVLKIKLLRKRDRQLESMAWRKSINSEKLLCDKRDMLQKYAKLAKTGFQDGRMVTQLFTEQEVKAVGLTEEESNASILSSYITSMADIDEEVKQALYAFPHLTHQEHLTSWDLVNEPKELQDTIQTNSGEADMTVLLTLGTAGDAQYHRLFTCIFPNLEAKVCSRIAQDALRAVLASPRRVRHGGMLFCMEALHESCQSFMAVEVGKMLSNIFNALILWDQDFTLVDCGTVIVFLEQLSKTGYTLEEVAIECRTEMSMLERLLKTAGRAYQGLMLGLDKCEEKEWNQIAEMINANPGLKRLIIIEDQPMVLSSQYADGGFHIVQNSNLQCFGLNQGVVNVHNFEQLCTNLMNLNGLRALDLSNNQIGAQSNSSTKLKALSFLAQVRYLKLIQCGLGRKDISAVAEVVVRNGIVWLDVSANDIGDEGANVLSQCLSDPRSQLVGLRMAKCEVHQEGTEALCEGLIHNSCLKVLNMSANVITGFKCILELIRRASTQEELGLFECNITTHGMCLIIKELKTNTCIKFLNLSGNNMDREPKDDNDLAQMLYTTLRTNHCLQALGLASCYLTDDTLKQIQKGLCSNSTLQLLDINDNKDITTAGILPLMLETNLQILNVSLCGLNEADLVTLAKALGDGDPHITIFMVGEEGSYPVLRGFLNEMCQYPDGGPLKYLLLYGDAPDLAPHVCHLEKKLQNTEVTFVKNGIPFYALSGLWRQSLPIDIFCWLYQAFVWC